MTRSRPIKILLWTWPALLLVGGGLAVAMALSPDPLAKRCEANAELLPAQIPLHIVLNVTDEDYRRLGPENLPERRQELHVALSRFPFSDRLFLRLTEGENSSIQEAFELPLRLYHRGPIEHPWYTRVGGRMCGAEILVAITRDSDFNSWKMTHELGHFFGLPHLERTYTMPDNKERAPRFDRFAECQAQILYGWDAGNPYVPHWTRGDCKSTKGPWDMIWPW